jgi:hypothetical protein
MDKPTFLDRRRFERIPLTMPVKFLDVASNQESMGQAHDISAQGIGLFTNQRLPPETHLEMWLEVPTRCNPLHFKGKVVWSEEIAPNHYRVGICLDKPQFLGMALVLEHSYRR